MGLLDVKKAIDKANTILLIAHIQPDGDTLGSSFALHGILQKLGKQVTICCDGNMPDRYLSLFPAALLLAPLPAEQAHDLVIAVDCADMARLGKCQKSFKRAAANVNIDHHVTNEGFAQINYIEEASSVGEIVYELMIMAGVEPDADIAKYMYIAMSTDTGNFTYSNTGRNCLAYTSELVGLFDLRETADVLFRRRSLVSTQLIGRALSRLETFADGQLASVTLLESDMKELKAQSADCENIVDFAREIEETKVAVFFRELPAGVKISFRSKGDYDVCTVAAQYGGGGHINAAGGFVAGKLEDIKTDVIGKLMELFA